MGRQNQLDDTTKATCSFRASSLVHCSCKQQSPQKREAVINELCPCKVDFAAVNSTFCSQRIMRLQLWECGIDRLWQEYSEWNWKQQKELIVIL